MLSYRSFCLLILSILCCAIYDSACCCCFSCWLGWLYLALLAYCVCCDVEIVSSSLSAAALLVLLGRKRRQWSPIVAGYVYMEQGISFLFVTLCWADERVLWAAAAVNACGNHIIVAGFRATGNELTSAFVLITWLLYSSIQYLANSFQLILLI